MLSGLKFIPREKITDAPDNSKAFRKKSKKSSSKEENRHTRQKSTTDNSSSDEENLGKIEGRSRRKRWYSSDEHSSSYSFENESEESSDQDDKYRHGRKRRSKGGRKKSSKEYSSSSDSEEGGSRNSRNKRHKRKSKEEGTRRKNEGGNQKDIVGNDSQSDHEIVRKEMGLEWMLRPEERRDKKSEVAENIEKEEAPASEIIKVNPRELNPYLKDNGSGYPEDTDQGARSSKEQLPSSSVVGDGGASWRLKALKRAQEQAAREGRKLDEVVEERWGSLGQLAVSTASHRAAPSRAHLHAIKSRKRGLNEETQVGSDNQTANDTEKISSRDYLKNVSSRHPEMREPKVQGSLSWGKQKSRDMSSKDSGIISAAASSLNKFDNDGSFMGKLTGSQSKDSTNPVLESMESNLILSETKNSNEGGPVPKHAMSANQLAAKALQLKMKGKHEEAEKLLKEVENMKVRHGDKGNSSRPENVPRTSRHIFPDASLRRKKEDDDGDKHLAQNIMQNKRFSISGRADDEYDYEDGPSRKSQKNRVKGDDQKANMKIRTQQERCIFCFENPNSPKHLIVSIATSTYLMLPQQQPVVPGHCCILPMQHESATRSVDKIVWEEIRNFKKCLIMMFAKQDKEMVFLETVMGLAQQRRHCLIECIPLPREKAKQAPLYFKKAIDEAEDEWSQHNAKRLINTSRKGLCGSIPENFPYFHVEFGLNEGFVHVIDDEKEFKSSLGLNVIRGILRLAEEDMYRRRRHESLEVQKQAVASFVRDWEPFDWTKQIPSDS